MDNTVLVYTHFKNLTFIRRWDFLLKNKSFITVKSFPTLSGLTVDLTVPSAENELDIIKALDFFVQVLPKVNIRTKPLHTVKKFNAASPLRITLKLRQHDLFVVLFELSNLYRLALIRHTFLSAGRTLNSVSFNLGNLNELTQIVSSVYDYTNWKAVLSFSFLINTGLVEQSYISYFFSTFGIFYTDNNIFFLDEAFNF